MKRASNRLTLFAALALGSACPGGDDAADGGSDGASEGGTGGTMTTTVAMTTQGTDTMPDTGPDGSGTADDTGDTGATDDGTTGDGDGSSDSTGRDPALPTFEDTAIEDYVQQDRMGRAGIALVLISAANREAYNQGSPADDNTGTWQLDYAASLDALMLGTGDGDGLFNDLEALGYTRCLAPIEPSDNCYAQAANLFLPDALAIDLDTAWNANNAYAVRTSGRPLDIPFVDVLLGLALLDFGPHDSLDFQDLNHNGVNNDSLNPLTNDVAFPGTWPWLAPPH